MNEALTINGVETDEVRLMLLAEVANLQAAYTEATTSRGQTTVGLTQLNLDEIADHIVLLLNGPHEKKLAMIFQLQWY
jgi:hypothetical protein